MSSAGSKLIAIDTPITLPADAPITVTAGHVRYQWTLMIRTELSGKPTYKVDHDVAVTNA
ncbi:MAG: hypothetical protein QM770_24985 [Tepidisphaeraceae bacterium]